MCFAALEETLRLWLAGAPLPIDRLWHRDEQMRSRLQRAADELGADIVPAQAFVGGGSAPEAAIEGHALALADSSGELSATLRRGSPAVVGYVNRGCLILDLRTIDPQDDDQLISLVKTALAARAQ